MKAEFKRTKTADGLALTIGKMYDVMEIKTEKRPWVIKEVKVKNDLGQEQWYKASRFKLFAEAAAFLKEPAAAGAGQSAAQSATPDGTQMMQGKIETEKQIYVGIDMANGTDQTAGFHNGEMLPLGKTIELYYGA